MFSTGMSSSSGVCRYEVCTVGELKAALTAAAKKEAEDKAAGIDTKKETTGKVEWLPCPNRQSILKSVSGAAEADENAAAYRFNKKGRVVVRTLSGRELLVFMRPPSSSGGSTDDSGPVVAMDRNCYHVGYPLDLGELQKVHEKLPDLEDIGNKTEGTNKETWCINCPLHNRIFCLKTGHMMGYDMEESEAENAAKQKDSPCNLLASSRGCRQRLHPVELQTSTSASNSSTSNGDENTKMIVVVDTFVEQGLQDEVRVAAGSTGLFVREAMQELSKKPAFVPSDKYNLPEVLLLQKHQEQAPVPAAASTASAPTSAPDALEAKRFRRE